MAKPKSESKTSPEVWELITRKGQRVLVDASTYLAFKDSSVYVNAQGYPCVKRRTLHRLVMNPGVTEHVDHINRNKLDCRISNLRICSNQQNTFNQDKKPYNTSGYKGVSFDSVNNKWVARIRAKNKQLNLGRFTDKKQAALAYNKAAKKYHGEFALLNEVVYG